MLAVGSFAYGQSTVHPAPIQFRNVRQEMNKGSLMNCWDEVNNPKYPDSWDKYCDYVEH